jgi:UDP-glucose 4-epimerase
MKLLISGGAGYIGSTIASACLDQGVTPVIVDNLVTGKREYTEGRIFYEGDIADGALIDRIYREHPDIQAVIHCSALIVVPDSVADPVGYYRANVAKSLDFISHLIRNKCSRLIFSSSASIYRASDDFTVTERSPLGPQSPYARTKAVCEAIFEDIAATQPIRVLSLRYFNPIGADPKMRTGLHLARPSHALGKLVEAHESGRPFHVTGTSYPTRDGSGIRDYVHVWDLARAHLAALEAFDRILAGANRSQAVNIGTGSGTTVTELVDAFNRLVEVPVEILEAEARPGDVAGAYTSSELARELLGWSPQYTIVDGIRHSLEWMTHRRDRLGY